MKALFYAPTVPFANDEMGRAGFSPLVKRFSKEVLGDEGQFAYEEASRQYGDVLAARIDALPLEPGFKIYCQMTLVTRRVNEHLSDFGRNARRGEYLGKIVVALVERGGQLVPIDSNYITQKILRASHELQKTLSQYGHNRSQAMHEYSSLMPAVGAHRGSVINKTLQDGQQGILLEYGDTGRTLNFLTEDIVVNRVIDQGEYKRFTQQIPQNFRRF